MPRAATLCVAVFRDEEGWRFGEGCFGSRCLCGTVTEADLQATDADGVSIREALAALGYPEPRGGGTLPAAFVEVHIEQGPVLERRGLAHAVVTSIAGMSGFTATITGSPGHAGTTPMEGRRDALLAAAELALALRERATTDRRSGRDRRQTDHRRCRGQRDPRAGHDLDRCVAAPPLKASSS